MIRSSAATDARYRRGPCALPHRGLCDTWPARGVAQPGSALRSGRRGPEFESRHPDEHVRPFHEWVRGALPVQAITVLGPRQPPRLVRRAWLGLIPLAAIGGVALLLAERPSLAQQATDLAAIATPIAAAGGLFAFRVRALALLTPVLYVIAWKGDGRPAQIATDALIAGAAVTLAWLTGTVAPRGGLIVGILAASAVDVYQVVVSEQVQVASHALSAAQPVSDLPRLQELVWGTASMGWGDAYLAALLGVVVAGSVLRTRLVAAGGGLRARRSLRVPVPRARHAARDRAGGRGLLIAMALDATVHETRRRKLLMATTQTRRDERLLIGGEWVEATGGGRFDVTNPATGEVVGPCPTRPPTTCARAIDAAAGALEGWRSAAALERGAHPARVGRPDARARRRDRARHDRRAGQAAGRGERRGRVRRQLPRVVRRRGRAHLRPDRAAAERENRVLVLRQAVGVTAAITPWNFPAAMMTRKLGPAMAAGCTSIVKPASATPLTAAAIVRCIEDAGVPEGRRQPRHVALVRHGRARAVRRPARAQDLVHRLDRGRQGADPALRRPASSGCRSSSAATRRT